MISTHLLPESTFTELAGGGGSPAAIALLSDAQSSKHLMLLHSLAEGAAGSGRGPEAFRHGWDLLARLRAAEPMASAWLLGLPHLGGWAHDSLIRQEQGRTPDFAHFACLVAAAAIRVGMPFGLDVPVRGGHIQLPGLGCLRVTSQSSWIRLSCNGERVTAGRQLDADWRLLVPDDGFGSADSGPGILQWRGTAVVAAAAEGLTWHVLLETSDAYLDRYTLPMAASLPADELRLWRQRIQAAWAVLARHHRQAAEAIAAGISVIVPLTPHSATDLVSATTPAAFGAIATSWPPDPVTLAETLVHEFQHVKLCGLMDMVPLAESGGDQVYAPWRQDPRPAAGLLQGVYAHLGITDFWRIQQHAETGQDDTLRAQVLFARWRLAIGQAVQTLLQAGCLTPAGARFVGLLGAQGQDFGSEPVPREAQQIAAEAALDHWLNWQIRHVAFDTAQVAGLAAAYRRGEPLAGRTLARSWTEEETRKVDSALRSRLLNMRYLDPARYRELCSDVRLPLSAPDRLLISGETSDAVQAYCARIADSADPQPDAWIGLALAVHRLPPAAIQAAFATRLALMFEIHACLASWSDPLELAGWFG